jgi:hypothetical protein
MRTWTSPKLPVEGLEAKDVSRADAVFTGVDHTRESYEARVYIGNRRASIETGLDPEKGYAGSYTIFGHGGCFGEEGHCDPERRYTDEFDLRSPHPARPQTKTVMITDALKRVLPADEVEITVVAIDHSGKESKPSDVMEFQELRLLVYSD